MTDSSRIDLLRDAASGVPVAPLDAASLVRRGRARRRRRTAVVGSVAAVLVVAGASYGVAAAGRDAPTTPSATTSSPTPSPGIPDGTRLAGGGSLVVAVPGGWSANEQNCGQPTAPTVIPVRGLWGARGCLITATWPYLAVADRAYFDRLGASLDDLGPTDLDGVLASPTPAPEPGGRDRSVSWVVDPDHGVYLLVATRSAAATQAIVDTARLLPADQTTVPLGDDEMRAAGLDVVEVPVRERGYSNGYLLGTDPGFGAVVPAGSTVRVRVVDNSTTDWPAGLAEARPAAMECVYDYPTELGDRAGAVDGTVLSVERSTNRGPGRGSPGPLTLTLAVHQWLRGGSGPEVELHTFPFALPGDEQRIVGTRILAAFGPTHDLMACGFTQPWDAATVDQWAAAFG